jgi:hypothetical protein
LKKGVDVNNEAIAIREIFTREIKNKQEPVPHNTFARFRKMFSSTEVEGILYTGPETVHGEIVYFSVAPGANQSVSILIFCKDHKRPYPCIFRPKVRYEGSGYDAFKKLNSLPGVRAHGSELLIETSKPYNRLTTTTDWKSPAPKLQIPGQESDNGEPWKKIPSQAKSASKKKSAPVGLAPPPENTALENPEVDDIDLAIKDSSNDEKEDLVPVNYPELLESIRPIFEKAGGELTSTEVTSAIQEYLGSETSRKNANNRLTYLATTGYLEAKESADTHLYKIAKKYRRKPTEVPAPEEKKGKLEPAPAPIVEKELSLQEEAENAIALIKKVLGKLIATDLSPKMSTLKQDIVRTKEEMASKEAEIEQQRNLIKEAEASIEKLYAEQNNILLRLSNLEKEQTDLKTEAEKHPTVSHFVDKVLDALPPTE